jgi:hypothetical protein
MMLAMEIRGVYKKLVKIDYLHLEDIYHTVLSNIFSGRRSDLYWSDILGVAVLSLDNDVNMENENAESIACLKKTSSSSTIDSNSAVHRVLPINCESSECVECLAYRHDLVNLDVCHIARCTDLHLRDEETIAFMSAMMMFSEWDEFERPSYLWPSLIIDLIRSPREWKSWRKCIARYNMPKGRSAKYILSRLLNLSLGKLYFFFLCLAHVGFDVNEDLGSLLNKLSAIMENDEERDYGFASPVSSSPSSPRLNSPCSIRNYFHKVNENERWRNSPLSQASQPQGSGGLKRSKTGNHCSLMTLGAPHSTSISQPEAKPEKSTSMVHVADDTSYLSLTPTETCVLDLINSIRVMRDIVQVVDDEVLIKFFRRSSRVGTNFQALDLPPNPEADGRSGTGSGSGVVATGEKTEVSSVIKAEAEKFNVFKPGVLSDQELDGYLQRVKESVPVELGDLVEAWKSPSPPSSLCSGGGDSSSASDDKSASVRPALWRSWNETSRLRRLNMHHSRSRNQPSIRGSGVGAEVKAPIGVVIACETDETQVKDTDTDVNASKKVWIFDGKDHFSVMARDVRLVTFSEDRALDLLHGCGYKVEQGLEAVRECGASGAFRDTVHWDVQDVNKFVEAFQWYATLFLATLLLILLMLFILFYIVVYAGHRWIFIICSLKCVTLV